MGIINYASAFPVETNQDVSDATAPKISSETGPMPCECVCVCVCMLPVQILIYLSVCDHGRGRKSKKVPTDSIASSLALESFLLHPQLDQLSSSERVPLAQQRGDVYVEGRVNAGAT